MSPQLRRILVVVVLGSIMSFLDATIVNVALESLSTQFHTDLSVIQWVITAYLLGLAAMIPVSGWAAARYGARTMFAVSIGLFTLASLACSLAQTPGQLIAFRAVQGVAGGFILPVGQMIAARAAGPQLMARVMSAIAIPTLLAPVMGPVIGGLLLDHAAWQWIFLINLPIGLMTVLLALRLLPEDQRGPAPRMDFLGLLLVTSGFVALTYGLADIGTEGHLDVAVTVPALVAGALLLAAFVPHALRTAQPLMDLTLFRNPVYSASSLTNFCLGAALFGSIILMPLYFQIVRHEDTTVTGLLLVPQGIGGAIAMAMSAKLTDQIGSGRTTLIGGAVSIVATVPFLLLGTDTSYWLLGIAMALRGFGIGMCAIPTTTAAYRSVPLEKIADATVQIGVIQRLGGSTGTALFAVVLQSRLSTAATPAAQAEGFGTAFWWVLATAILATAPAFILTAAERRTAPLNSAP
ncbi:DHA2 family efflux MFS transporter permease subunit [Actinocorallia sp. B10E7]